MSEGDGVPASKKEMGCQRAKWRDEDGIQTKKEKCIDFGFEVICRPLKEAVQIIFK